MRCESGDERGESGSESTQSLVWGETVSTVDGTSTAYVWYKPDTLPPFLVACEHVYEREHGTLSDESCRQCVDCLGVIVVVQ